MKPFSGRNPRCQAIPMHVGNVLLSDTDGQSVDIFDWRLSHLLRKHTHAKQPTGGDKADNNAAEAGCLCMVGTEGVWADTAKGRLHMRMLLRVLLQTMEIAGCPMHIIGTEGFWADTATCRLPVHDWHRGFLDRHCKGQAASA
jgi:hypothetical protein